MDQKKRRASRDRSRSRSNGRKRSRERRVIKDKRYREKSRRDSYSYSKSRSRDRKPKKSDRYRHNSRSSSYSDRGKHRSKGKVTIYNKYSWKNEEDSKKWGKKDRRIPADSRSQSKSSDKRGNSIENEYQADSPNSKVDRLVSKLTGRAPSIDIRPQNGHSSYSSKHESKSVSPSPVLERDTKPPRKEHHQKDTKPAFTTKAQPSSQAPNNVVSEKVAAAKPEKVDQIDHSLASKDLKLQKGTGLFQKAPKSNDSKPKLVLCRPQIPQKPHETRQLSIASRAKRSTGAFEIYEYPALKIAPETIERHEHTSLHHRITKKESNQGPGGSFDIRSRIIKKPHKF